MERFAQCRPRNSLGTVLVLSCALLGGFALILWAITVVYQSHQSLSQIKAQKLWLESEQGRFGEVAQAIRKTFGDGEIVFLSMGHYGYKDVLKRVLANCLSAGPTARGMDRDCLAFIATLKAKRETCLRLGKREGRPCSLVPVLDALPSSGQFDSRELLIISAILDLAVLRHEAHQLCSYNAYRLAVCLPLKQDLEQRQRDCQTKPNGFRQILYCEQVPQKY